MKRRKGILHDDQRWQGEPGDGGSLQLKIPEPAQRALFAPLKAQGAVATVLRFSPQSIEQHMRAEADRIDDDHHADQQTPRRFSRH